MRSLVVGIVLVGLATLAFNLYMREDSGSAPLIAQAQRTEQIPQISAVQPEPDVEPTAIEPVRSAPSRSVPAVRPSRSVSRAEKAAVSSRKPSFVRKDTPAAFTDTVIYYNVPAKREPTIAAVAPQRRAVRSQKKRSVLAKTFSVVKKPYDWVKYAFTRL